MNCLHFHAKCFGPSSSTPLCIKCCPSWPCELQLPQQVYLHCVSAPPFGTAVNQTPTHPLRGLRSISEIWSPNTFFTSCECEYTRKRLRRSCGTLINIKCNDIMNNKKIKLARSLGLYHVSTGLLVWCPLRKQHWDTFGKDTFMTENVQHLRNIY